MTWGQQTAKRGAYPQVSVIMSHVITTFFILVLCLICWFYDLGSMATTISIVDPKSGQEIMERSRS